MRVAGVKAEFVVTLVYPDYCMALSNMPESRCESLKDGRRKATFMKTPKMSTYVLAYCIVGTDEVGAVFMAVLVISRVSMSLTPELVDLAM